jgi:hypothetical protein
MSTARYEVDNVPSDITNLIVTTFRIVAHTMGPVAPGAAFSQNHWSIYLIHTNGSVRLNMELADPSSTSSRGAFTITSYAYTASNSAVIYWDFQANQNVAVYWVIKLISDSGRHRYDMTAGGVGCRHWM